MLPVHASIGALANAWISSFLFHSIFLLVSVFLPHITFLPGSYPYYFPFFSCSTKHLVIIYFLTVLLTSFLSLPSFHPVPYFFLPFVPPLRSLLFLPPSLSIFIGFPYFKSFLPFSFLSFYLIPFYMYMYVSSRVFAHFLHSRGQKCAIGPFFKSSAYCLLNFLNLFLPLNSFFLPSTRSTSTMVSILPNFRPVCF